jgi:hypothetical protein
MNTDDTLKEAVLFLLNEYQELVWALRDRQRGINQDYDLADRLDCDKTSTVIHNLIEKLS